MVRKTKACHKQIRANNHSTLYTDGANDLVVNAFLVCWIWTLGR